MARNKKTQTPIVDAKVKREAERIVFQPEPRKTFACKVCGDPGATEQSEGLCWVCRRLKVSAWREVEMQIPMNE